MGTIWANVALSSQEEISPQVPIFSPAPLLHCCWVLPRTKLCGTIKRDIPNCVLTLEVVTGCCAKLQRYEMVHFFTTAQCELCSVRCSCIFFDPISDTIRRRGRYRGILREEGEDTGAYFRGNHRCRV